MMLGRLWWKKLDQISLDLLRSLHCECLIRNSAAIGYMSGSVTFNGLWTVKDKQGNTYFFEHVSQYPYKTESGSCPFQPFRWSMTRVRNIFGQEITYNYEDQLKPVRCSPSDYPTPTAVYPVSITYGSSRYRVYFDRGSSQNRGDYPLVWDSDPLFHTFEKQRLQNIYVQQDTNSDGIFETILRRYEFQYANNTDPDIIFPGYTWTAGDKTTTLRSVREYGVGGTTALPATTFTYDGLHLTRAQNGYGGAVEFDYGLWYSSNARASHTIGNNFGQDTPGTGKNPCVDGTPSPWGARIGNIDCRENEGKPYPLKLNGPSGIAQATFIRNPGNSPYQNSS
jgi:hypothetical protein